MEFTTSLRDQKAFQMENTNEFSICRISHESADYKEGRS